MYIRDSGSVEMLHQLEDGYNVTRVTVDWVNSELFYVAKSASNSRVWRVLWVESILCIVVVYPLSGEAENSWHHHMCLQ